MGFPLGGVHGAGFRFRDRKVHKKLARTSDAATRVMVTALQADRGRSLPMGGGSPFGPRFWFGPEPGSAVLLFAGLSGLELCGKITLANSVWTFLTNPRGGNVPRCGFLQKKGSP